MLESILDFVVQNADWAHYLLFGLFMLAGLNVPISEDLLLMIGGVLAATVVPEHTMLLFVWCFLGAYLSDWEAYWIGRRLGQGIWETRWLKGFISRRRLAQINNFYDKYGAYTLFFGRFVPFGVRNCLFISAGMGKMPFSRFLVWDGIACIVSNSVVFFLAYSLGQNRESIEAFLHSFHISALSIFILVILGVLASELYRRRKARA